MRKLWTNAQRHEAAKRARLNAPWNHSTGPRTAAGKAISSRNSYKHGRYSYERQLLRWYVRLAAMRVKRLNAAINHVAYDYRNEVTSKYYPHLEKTPDRMAYYPYFKVHPLSNEALYPPKKPRQKTERQKQKEIFDFFTSLGDPNWEG